MSLLYKFRLIIAMCLFVTCAYGCVQTAETGLIGAAVFSNKSFSQSVQDEGAINDKELLHGNPDFWRAWNFGCMT